MDYGRMILYEKVLSKSFLKKKLLFRLSDGFDDHEGGVAIP